MSVGCYRDWSGIDVGDKIDKNKMGWACSADRGGERREQGFGEET
jgi:hypothetical protein